MPKYIIERNIEGAGDRTGNSGATASNKVLKEMNDEGKNIHWQHNTSFKKLFSPWKHLIKTKLFKLMNSHTSPLN